MKIRNYIHYTKTSYYYYIHTDDKQITKDLPNKVINSSNTT